MTRYKKFLGAAIGAVTSVATGLINKNQQNRKQRRANRIAQIEDNKASTFEAAQAMSDAYSNQDYVNEYNKKITLKNGGKVMYKDRFNKTKNKTKNKKALGGIGIGNITSSLQNAIPDLLMKTEEPYNSVRNNGASTFKTSNRTTNIGGNNNTLIDAMKLLNSNQVTLRCGGKRKRK